MSTALDPDDGERWRAMFMNNMRRNAIPAVVALVLLFGLLLVLLLPARGTRERNLRNACRSNMYQIDGAKQQWAIEGGHPQTAVPQWQDITPYIHGGTVKCWCPKCRTRRAEDSYELRAVNQDPVCKIDPASHNMD